LEHVVYILYETNLVPFTFTSQNMRSSINDIPVLYLQHGLVINNLLNPKHNNNISIVPTTFA